MQKRDLDANGSLVFDTFLCLESCLIVLNLNPRYFDKSNVSKNRKKVSVMKLS